MILTEILLFALVSAVLADPPALSACDAGDNECIKNVTQELFTNYYGGYWAWNVSSLDPYFIPSLNLTPLPSSPIDVQFSMTDVVDTGYANAKVISVSGFGTTPGGEQEIIISVPYVNLVGNAVTTGSAYNFPVNGNGTFNLTAYNLVKRLVFNTTSVTRANVTYLSIDNLVFDYNETGMVIDFNFYDGYPEYSNFINDLINNDMGTFVVNYKKAIVDKFTVIYENKMKSVFDFIPLDVLFNTV